MIPFDPSFFEPVEFLPNDPILSAEGAPLEGIPASGTMTRASIQSASTMRLEKDGLILSRLTYNLFIPDDPSTLHGGLGVLADDIFRRQSDGRRMQALGPAVRLSLGTDCFLWRVECVDTE